MTQLTKPITRESACYDRGRPLVITLFPRHLEIRPKGLRRRYTISYDAALWVAVKPSSTIGAGKRPKRKS